MKTYILKRRRGVFLFSLLPSLDITTGEWRQKTNKKKRSIISINLMGENIYEE
jgi:hypothetical protein